MSGKQPSNCVVCAMAGEAATFAAREMYFGTRERFDYFECAHCGTVQIARVPADLSRHYPAEYYSFSAMKPKRTSALQRTLRGMRTDAWLGRRGGVAGPWRGSGLLLGWHPDPRPLEEAWTGRRRSTVPSPATATP